MNSCIVRIPEAEEIEAKKYLLRLRPHLQWYTTWKEGLGYITVVTFDNKEEAMEFQLKFSGFIDYQ